MNDWWTEENMLKVVRERINPDENSEHIFTCASFGASFYLTAITLGMASLFFVKRYIMVLTTKAVYFIEHKGQISVSEVAGVNRYPYEDLSIQTHKGMLNNFITFRSTKGWRVKMQFPKRRYNPSSDLTNWQAISEKLLARCHSR